MAKEPPSNCISLDEEIEGDRDGTSDFVFCRIGSSVPLKRSDSGFSLEKPPVRPLAVSERFGLLFLVHTGGFLVAKTIDVIKLAKDIKEIEEGHGNKKDVGNLCVQEKCILDAQIGDVHLLALSTDSSLLAAALGREVHFFSVPSLVDKKQEPIFTCSLGESGHIKNFLWRKNMENSFVALSICGLLYRGYLQNHLEDIMDGVEAVDWSVEGNYLAVARNNVLSILSSEFKEQLNMSLLFQSWTGDAESKFTLKVDSIKWLRSDSIIIGCVQVDENDDEVDYMVQVITTEGAGSIEACSKPVLVSFNDLFRGIADDIIPSGCGPHLFLSYLEHWDLAIAANRKNTDEHVVLLAWLANDDRKVPVALEFEQEKFIPRIELQENRDENLLLGIDVDRISIHEKLELKIDSEVKVLSPHCILLCLSFEGKLIMFHVARISEPAASHETFLKPLDDVGDVNKKPSEALPVVGGSIVSTTRLKGEELTSHGDVHPLLVKEQPNILSARNEKTDQNSKVLQSSVDSYPKQGISSAFVNLVKSGSQVYNFTRSSTGMSTSSSLGSILGETSAISHLSKASSKHDEAGPTFTHVNDLQFASFGVQSMGKPNASYGYTVRSPLFNSSGSIPGDSHEALEIQRHGISQSSSTAAQPTAKMSKDSISSSDVSKSPLRLGHIEPVPAIHSSAVSSKGSSIPGKFLISNMQDVFSSSRAYRSPRMQENEPKLSKQFYSVNDMAEELDTLLSYIEQEGGFRDACTVVQRSLVLSLEEGLKNLSEKFRMCKAKMEEQLKEIQWLQDKRMQVSARQIYMEGLVKQASNGQYWDIWNCQKLCPEFEVKQQRISKLNHGLVNELVELERHFNALELNKYGESSPAPKGRRALLGSLESSRQISSLHILYNTLSSQLAAAEQLSECLSKQMAVLNISSPPKKHRSITKQLLESIGLEYDSDLLQSPEPKSGYSPDFFKKLSFLSSSSGAIKEPTRRNTLSTLKTFEPESLRRRRDSLDRSWTRFVPPKTTVKRMLQEESFKVGAEKFLSPTKVASDLPISEGFHTSQKRQEALSSSLESSMNKFQSQVDKVNKGDQKKLPKQFSESQSDSLLKWTKGLSQPSQALESRFPVTLDMKTGIIQSTPVATSSLSSFLNKTQELGSLADKSIREVPDRERQPVSSTVEVDSLTKSRFSVQFDASVHNQTAVEVSSGIFSPKITSAVTAVQLNEPLNVKSQENGPIRLFTGSTGQAVTPKSSFSMSEKSHPSLSASISGNVFQVKTVRSRSQSSGTSSSTTLSTAGFPSLPLQLTTSASPPLVSVSKSPAFSSIKHMDESSPVTTSQGALSPTSLPSLSSVAANQALHSYSTSSFQTLISKTPEPVSLPQEDITSQASLITSHSRAPQDSEPTEVRPKPQPTTPQSPMSGSVAAGLTTDGKPTTLSSAVSVVSSTFQTLSEIPAASSNLPSASTKGQDEGLDITITEEDEMEEEAPEANTMLNLGALDSFGLGPTSASSAPKANPFGGSLIASTANPTSTAFSLTSPTGELFRPASFSLPSSQPIQSSQAMSPGGFSGGFSGFGQLAQLGVGQQALGSVLGAFGQSRQLGVQGIGFASSSGFGGGGFSASVMSGGGGFAAAAASGGGFSTVSSSAGGFSGASAGGFAAMASKPGGFAAAASAAGGFGAPSGGSGGFGSFGAKQGVGGFSQFGGTTTTGAGKPPAELLTQMRK